MVGVLWSSCFIAGFSCRYPFCLPWGSKPCCHHDLLDGVSQGYPPSQGSCALYPHLQLLNYFSTSCQGHWRSLPFDRNSFLLFHCFVCSSVKYRFFPTKRASLKVAGAFQIWSAVVEAWHPSPPEWSQGASRFGVQWQRLCILLHQSGGARPRGSTVFCGLHEVVSFILTYYSYLLFT